MKRIYTIILSALVATALTVQRAEAQYVKFSLGLEAGGSALMLLPTPESDLYFSGGAQGGLAVDIHAGRFIGVSAAAGLKLYLGQTVYLTLRGTYGLSYAYNIYGNGAIPASAQLGIGFRLYNYRKSAFKL